MFYICLNIFCSISTRYRCADVHMQQRALWVPAAAFEYKADSGGRGGELQPHCHRGTECVSLNLHNHKTI